MSSNKIELCDIETAEQAADLREEVNNQLCPEFEWYGKYLTAFPVFSSRTWRKKTKYFLEPFLISVCGASIPRHLPIQMRAGSTPLLKQVRDHLCSYYRTNRTTPQTASVANANATASDLRGPKKGKKPCKSDMKE